jgi:predicted GNAT family N-acyltransferase
MTIEVKQADSSKELEEAFNIRHLVFVQEQNVPIEIERDLVDTTAIHGIAIDQQSIVGTGRLVIEGNGNVSIGRMAVNQTARRQGIGAKLLFFLEKEAEALSAKLITLHAQTYVKSFYAKHGYQESGETFIEAGIEHILMTKNIP